METLLPFLILGWFLYVATDRAGRAWRRTFAPRTVTNFLIVVFLVFAVAVRSGA